LDVVPYTEIHFALEPTAIEIDAATALKLKSYHDSMLASLEAAIWCVIASPSVATPTRYSEKPMRGLINHDAIC